MFNESVKVFNGEKGLFSKFFKKIGGRRIQFFLLMEN